MKLWIIALVVMVLCSCKILQKKPGIRDVTFIEIHYGNKSHNE